VNIIGCRSNIKVATSIKKEEFIMKKKILSALVCATLVFSMTACGVTAPETSSTDTSSSSSTASTDTSSSSSTATASTDDLGDPVTLVFAEVNPLDTIVGMTDSKFKEEVESLSGGNITIDLQASGVLGSENDVLDTMLGGGGTIDMSRISAFALTSYGGEKSMLLSLPYTFVSREHFWNFATSDLAEEFLLEPSENGSGVRGLFYGEEGFRHFFTVNEVTGIDSFKGLKIRVSNDPVMNGLVEGLGANPTVVSFNELYSALSTGVVDGAEQPIANYKSNAFPEVAPNLILDGHTLGAIQVIITDDAWNKLTEAQQDILTQAGKTASEYNRSISEDKENEVLEQLKADGVNVIEVEDKTPWQEAVQSVIEENTKGLEDLYQQILDMQ
jgi:tripartite ATP-independent transporter DctP family solute receptor